MRDDCKDMDKEPLKIDPAEAERIYKELYETMVKTVGPWSANKIFDGGPDTFEPERPVESIHKVIGNMSKMLGVKTAKRITLLAIKDMK